MKPKKKIAIIGAGIFGCTLAIILSKKFDVQIFEKKRSILNEASKMNQFRFHLGFHYPRSQKTIKEIQKDYKDFIKFYGKKVYGNTDNYYLVSKTNSKIKFKKYLKTLKRNKLKFKIIKKSTFCGKAIEGVIKTSEKILNYFSFKKKILKILKIKKIKINFGTQFQKKYINDFDYLFLCTYRNNNKILNDFGFRNIRQLRYELVEKILVKLPKKYQKLSCVVIDGKFLCIDPYINTNLHLLSHVKFSKIIVQNKKIYNFDKKKFLLKKEVIKNIKISQFSKIVKSGQKYLPFLSQAKYIKSFYLIRTLNINSMVDDDRTNQVKRINKKIFTILSGKWNTAVSLSNEILRKLT